jgi:hypothetical protein
MAKVAIALSAPDLLAATLNPSLSTFSPFLDCTDR